MRDDEVFPLVRGAVVLVLEVPAASVQEQTQLARDLQADSLALIEIVEVVEQRLRAAGIVVHVEDEEIERLTTVGDAVELVRGRL